MRAIDVKIEDVAFGGSGVGRVAGKAVFIPYTIEGEVVSARIVREKKQFAQAEVTELRETSEHRVTPPCPYFGRCGGCAYQHIDYAHQLEIKSRQVAGVLKRIGKIQNVPMETIVPSPHEYAYRNRITVHAQDGVIGYFQRDSHQLIDVESCPIAMETVNHELSELRSHDVPDGHYTLRAESERRIFSQTNDDVAKMMLELIDNLISPGQDMLIDAFCGAGFFAKALLPKFKQVIGIDWDRFAIAAAKENASPKETYIAGNVEAELKRICCDAQQERGYTLIVDPPAVGLNADVRRIVADFLPRTFIYVSCNPATLARDLSEFESSFSIESITPLDMFPQTAEIEVIAHLRRRNDSTI